MRKLLIIGAGFLQSFVIKKAKEMGYYTIAIDKNPKSLGFLHADEYRVIDIIDKETCLKFAQEKLIDGVVTAATDYGVLSASYIAKQMNLPGLNYEIAKVIKNKYKVRRILYERQVDALSQFYELNNIREIDNIKHKIEYPVIVKPCDGSGSKGVKKVNTLNELKNACEEAFSFSLAKKVLVEDYIEGIEYGVESFVYNNQVHVLGVMGKYMTNHPYYAELGHYMPVDSKVDEKVKKVVESAINALKVNFGSINMDVIVTHDNRVSIVDVGVRMGGNLIGSHIIPKGTGIDYIGNIVRAAVGDSVSFESNSITNSIVTRLLALTPGKVVELPDFAEISAECDVEIYHNLSLNSIISEYRNNLDSCGYIVSISKKLQDAVNRAEKAKRLIDIGIKRDSSK